MTMSMPVEALCLMTQIHNPPMPLTFCNPRVVWASEIDGVPY